MKIINLKDTQNRLFYIGGVVRDELLGIASFDVDLTYVGDAIEYAKTLENVEILKVNEPFGTVRIKVEGEEIDLASTRSEFYPKNGHLPVVCELGCELKKDVQRRDFTINAMAKSFTTGEIVDYTGGLADLRDKKLRGLHDKSFIEDPTRILRGLKFSVRFGFELEPHTQSLQENYLENVNYDMSFKRVKKEIKETFNLNSNLAFEKFKNEGIYRLISQTPPSEPKTAISPVIEKYAHLINPQNIWLIYLATMPDIERLLPTFDREELRIVESFREIQNFCPQDDFEIYKMFEQKPLEAVILYGVMTDLGTATRYLDKLKDIKLTITGKDLVAMGFKPSKKFSDCFDFVLRKKITTPTLTCEDELSLAREFFKE